MQLGIGCDCRAWRQKREIDRMLNQLAARIMNHHGTDRYIGYAKQWTPGKSLNRKTDGGTFKPPGLARLLLSWRRHADRETRQKPRVLQGNFAGDRGLREDMLG